MISAVNDQPPTHVAAAAHISDRDGAVVDLRRLLLYLLRYSWIVLIAGTVGGWIGIQQVRDFPRQFVAQMTLLPEANPAGALGNQLTAALGTLGIGVGASGGSGGAGVSTIFERLRVTIGSTAFAELLQERHGLLQRVYASQWDAELHEWKRPPPEKGWRAHYSRLLGFSTEWLPPSAESLSQYLRSSVRFTKEIDGPFVVVTFSHPDRVFAYQLLNLVYNEADSLLRDQDRVEAERRREYLEAQLRTATNVDMRQALTAVLTSELRREMLLRSDFPYAARVIEAPFVLERPEAPKVRTLLMLPIIVALLASSAVLTLIFVFRE